MKLFNAVTIFVKMLLSIAGIVLLINKLSDKKTSVGYKYNVDSALNKEPLKVYQRPQAKKRFDFSDLQKSYFHSMDY